jgi:hypothetical protein
MVMNFIERARVSNTIACQSRDQASNAAFYAYAWALNKYMIRSHSLNHKPRKPQTFKSTNLRPPPPATNSAHKRLPEASYAYFLAHMPQPFGSAHLHDMLVLLWKWVHGIPSALAGKSKRHDVSSAELLRVDINRSVTKRSTTATLVRCFVDRKKASKQWGRFYKAAHLTAAAVDVDGSTRPAAYAAGVYHVQRAAALRDVEAVTKRTASTACGNEAGLAAATPASNAGTVRANAAEGTAPAICAGAAVRGAVPVATAVGVRATHATGTAIALLRRTGEYLKGQRM